MVENITDLTDRAAVVIGGTSGLGRAIALALARSGARVVPAGRRAGLAAEAAAEIAQAGGEAFAQAVDVTDRHSIDALRDAALERFGRIDILVNAAGITARRPTAEVAEA